MSIYDVGGNALNSVCDVEGVQLSQAYDIDGNPLLSRPDYPSELTLLHSASISGEQSPQGMATYGGYIFQFFSTVNKMKIYRQSDYALVNEMDCTLIGHGNNLQFGNDVQSNGFPYLYASDSNSADARYIYVLSIDLNGLSLVRTINLPQAVGNFPNAVIDFENGKIYSVGYTENSVYTTSGKNIICVLDLNDPTTVLSTWQYDYLGVMNGLVWNGSNIVLNCNTWDGTDVKFYFINPTTKTIDHNLTFDKEYDSEYQGFSDENEYYLVSKWIYKAVSGAETLFYEFYRLW